MSQSRNYKNKRPQQQQDESQNGPKYVPKFVQPNFVSKQNQKTVFIKAQVIKVEELVNVKKHKELEQTQDGTEQKVEPQVPVVQTGHEEKYLSVTLQQVFSNGTSKSQIELRVNPPNRIFAKDFEEKKKAEHYELFTVAQKNIAEGRSQFVEILNAKIKNEKVKQQQDQPQQERKQNTIQLTEWTTVKLFNSINKFSDIKKIGTITANDKYVNILGLVTGIKYLENTTTQNKNQAPQNPDQKDANEKPQQIQITLSDETGQIHFILPNIEKFANKIDLKQEHQYLYFQKAQKQLTNPKDGECNVYLNIYINDKTDKQKGFINNFTNEAFTKEEVEIIKQTHTKLPHVSNKIWIVKTPQQ